MQEVASGELVVSALKLLPHSFSSGHGPSFKGLFWDPYHSSRLQSNISWWLPDVEPHSVSAFTEPD